MKKILLFCGAIFVTSMIVAQINCTPIFPGGVTIVSYHSDTVHVGGGDILWVCTGVTIDVQGTGNTAFIEKNCDVTISGDDQTDFFIKGPGTVTINSNNNNITHEPDVVVTDNGTGNTKQSCDTIFVDYALAPGTAMGGCDIYAGVQRIEHQEKLSYYPNPVSGSLTVNRLNIDGTQIMTMYNVSGQQVLEENLRNTQTSVDLRNLQPGLYLLKVTTSEGVSSDMISVQ